MHRIILASNNAHKLREIQEILHDLPISLVTPEQLGLDLDVPETGATFADNALLKARAFSQAAGLPALADDSGLCVDALAGAPGVRSARYGGPGLDDRARVERLLAALRDVPAPQRTARFVCVIALTAPDGREATVEGAADGVITREPRGHHGFGYDPIFEIPELGRTFAELTSNEKARYSHRGRALRAARDHLSGASSLLQ